MNTYEITMADGTTVSLAAAGYSWDKPQGCIRFYDSDGNKVATYSTGEWISLHMRSPLVMADRVGLSTGIKADQFAMYHGH